MLATLTAATALDASTLNEGLVADYRLNGDVLDATANGLHGTLNGAVATTDRFGDKAGALYFNGASWAQVPHSSKLDSLPFTVSAWFSSTADSPGPIVSKYENATWHGWGLNVERKDRTQPNSATGYYLGSTSNAVISGYGAPVFEAGQNLNDGTWHHIVMVVDQTSGRLYLDGALADEQLWRGAPYPALSSWPVYFGYYPHTYAGIGDANPYYTGSIDDVRVYGRALSSQEVDYLHAFERTPPGLPPTDIVVSATTIAENQPAGTVAGTLSTTDPDKGDSFTYSLVSGTGDTDNAAFAIVGNELRTATTFDYETRSAYSVRIRSIDAKGLFTDKQFRISVVNLGESVPDLRSGLIAHYELDGNAIDSSSRLNHGVAYKTVATQNRFGVDNAALYFNGVDAAVTVPHHSSLNTLPLSVSAWFRTTSTGKVGIVGKYQAAGWNGYQLTTESAGSVWPWYVTGYGRDVIGDYEINAGDNPSFRSEPLNDGGWHHVVFTVDQSGGTLFVDGKLHATKGWRGTPTIVSNSLPLYIGRYFGEQNGYLLGAIDDVRLYDRVLSGSEVMLLHGDQQTPTDITISASTMAENQPAGTVVGTLSTTDPDAGDTFTYSLVGGTGDTDNAAFTIVGNELRTAATFSASVKSACSIRIRSTDDTGFFVERTFTIRILGRPGMPTGLRGTPRNRQVSLSWTAPVSDGGSPITDYVIRYSADAGKTWTRFDKAVSPATSATVTGLVNGVAYVFKVIPINAFGRGQPSPVSSPGAPHTVPGVPTGLRGTPGNRQVSLSWTAPVSDGGSPISDYVIRYSADAGKTWARFDEAMSPATSATVTGLATGVAYVFKVIPINAAGRGLPSPVSTAFAPHTVPGMPTGLRGTPGNRQVDLAWTAPTSDGGSAIMDYVIRYSADAGKTWARFDEAVSPVTSATVTGLTNGVAYVFKVIPINAAGRGLPSPVSIPLTPHTVPEAPSGVSPSAGSRRAVLMWTAPGSVGGAPVSDYMVQYSRNNGTSWTTFPDSVTDSTTVTVTGLTPGVSYVFRVAAVNAAGLGAFSQKSRSVIPRA